MTTPPLNQLTLSYSPWKKLLLLLGLGFAGCLFWFGLICDFFIVEMVCVLLAAYGCWVNVQGLNTRKISFYPDKIVKTTYFGEISLPANALVRKFNQVTQSQRLFHGSELNLRESVRVEASLLSSAQRRNYDTYLRDVYRISDFFTPHPANSAASIEFNRVASSCGYICLLTGVYLLVYVLTASYLSWEYAIFNGFADQLPALPIRLLFFAFAISSYGGLRLLAKPPTVAHTTYSEKVQRAQQQAVRPIWLANALAWLGLPLFLLFGNRLDFYVLLLIGFVYFYDFYPRLSDWERLLQTSTISAESSPLIGAPRSSLQISLVLLGGFSLAGYSGMPNTLRPQAQNCQDASGNPIACPSGSGYSGSTGSGWSGSGFRRGNVVAEHASVSRGGFGSFGGFHGFSGG